ncbi:hypothetical protein [Pseudodesulfovibrio pelocollis]|uniref:hypothetical protein n=1 Tax=Pseudodesulfovibrio pelocollis TaxID=3051432 RepID=UPI00255ACA90|nr:hypothetical protein [Pseudodesulfovibrio sp. SB368]
MIPATPGTAGRLRPDLSVLVHETMTGAAAFGFIASRVAPYFPVSAQAADFPVLPAKYAFNAEEVHRAPGAAYKRSGGQFEAGHYSCRERGHEHPLDARFRAIYSSIIDMEAAGLNQCTNIVLRAYEIETAAKLQKPGNFLTGAASAKWSLPDDADPKADIKAAREIGRRKGVFYNTLIIAWPTYNNLCACKKVQDAVYAIFPDARKTGTIDISHLETYLEIRIELAGALVNGSNRAKNPALEDIWSDAVATLACVAAEGSDIVEPSIARTFKWNEGSSEEYVVEDYWDETVRATILRVRHDIDVRLLKSYDDDGNVLSDISKNCGYVFTGIK